MDISLWLAVFAAIGTFVYLQRGMAARKPIPLRIRAKRRR